MSDWLTQTFSGAPLQIIDGDRGVNYPTDFRKRGHCLFLNAGNVTINGFNFSSLAFIDHERDQLLRKGKLQRNDVVLTTRGTVGNAAFFDDSVPYQDIRINSGMVILRADPEKMWPRYLYLFVRSNAFLAQVVALTTGSAQPQLPIRDIQKIRIPLPTIAEQKAIANILGALDDKIELNRRMNETQETMARMIFKDWFVDFGPVRAKAEGRPSYLSAGLWSQFPDKLDENNKPAGWRSGRLEDVASPAGQSVKPDELSPDTPYIGLEHMPRRSISLDSWEGARKVTSGKLAFRRGDFLFGKLRPYFHKVGIAPIDGICSTDIVVLKAKKPIDWAFVISCISRDEFVAYTDQSSAGTKMPRTSWELMARYELTLPSDGLMKAFHELISPLFERIVDNIHESRTLAALRDLLLPKLMSGEIRLKDAEKTIAGTV